MTSTPLPYRARASHEGVVVADSSACTREDRHDEAPLLWFPRTDVTGEAPVLATTDTHVAFDHDVVEVTVVDVARGGDDRDATVKAWPVWGDAGDLVTIMDVAAEDEHTFRSDPRGADWRRPIVEGSQMLGQAIIGACRIVPHRRVGSATMLFTKAVNAQQPYRLRFDVATGGRTFSALDVRVEQGGRACTTGSLLLGVTSPDVIRHTDPMPDVAGPYDSAPHDMSVLGRDLRIVDDVYTGDPDAPVGPPELHTWVRFCDIPDDQPLHAGLLAQFMGHMPIAAALRPHAGIGQDQAHVTLSTAPMAISASFHADVDMHEWVLYTHRATAAGDGMSHAECRAYTESGTLLASFTVTSMIRAFDNPARGDAKWAM